MEKLIFERFGPVTRFDAAHIVDESGRVGAYVAEPFARDEQAGDWDEVAFRAAVEAEVASWEARNPGETLWIQYDPGRNKATEVQVELKG